MSRDIFDPKLYKHIKSDKNSTTLQHKRGHTLTIAHNVISPKMRTALEALSTIPKENATEGQLQESQDADQYGKVIQKADGGKIQKYADGDKVAAPQTRTNESDTAQRASDVSNVARSDGPSDQTRTLSSPSTMWNNLVDGVTKPGYADGGEVEEYAQGGNAGEQRKKIFGKQSSPSNKDMRAKHIAHIQDFAKSLLAVTMQPSGGKINAETGQRRDPNAEVGVDKPDWRSGQLESQWNPDAMMHELAHVALLPKGVGLKKGQELMDKQYGDVQKKYGYMQQKRSQGEVQPMAAEQIFRRHLGLPANTNAVPVKEGDAPRSSVEDPTKVIGTRIQKGEKVVDLIRQARNLSPENKERLEHILSGKLKFHPDYGWQDNPDALGAKSQMYKEEHPEALKKAMYDGGRVKYAEGTPNLEAPPSLRDPDTYGGGQHYDASARQDQDTGNEVAQSERVAKETLPQEINRNSDEVIRSAPPGIGEAQDIAKVKNVVPRIAELTPEQQGIYRTYNVMKNSGRAGDPSLYGDNFNENTGAPPRHVDIEALKQANMIFSNQQRSNQDALAANRQKVVEENAVRQKAGILPEPVPNSTQYEGLPGFENAQSIDANPQGAAPAANYNPYDYMPAQEGPAQPGFDDSSTAMTGDPGTDYMQGVGQQLRGAQSAEQAQQQIGQGRAQAAQNYDDAIALAQAHTTSNFNDALRERNMIVKEINEDKIDPERYWTGDKNGNGSHSKILSTIGIILGGIGGGWSGHGGNAALDNLHFQMQQNLEGQKAEIGKKNNLLAANLHQFGNIRDAADMTRIQMRDILANDLDKAAANASNPAAKAALLNYSGQIRKEAAPMAMTFAMQRAMMSLNNGAEAGSPDAQAHMISQMMAINPEKGKTYQQAFVPGVGLSSSLTPIPDSDRKMIAGYKTVLQQLDDALHFKDTHPGAAYSPQDRATAQTLMLNIGNEIRTAQDMGVWKQSEATMMNSLLGSTPAGFFSALKSDPKLTEMIRLKKMEQMNLHKQYGLPAPQGPASQQPTGPQTTIRVTPDGKKAIFNTATKQFLGYQK